MILTEYLCTYMYNYVIMYTSANNERDKNFQNQTVRPAKLSDGSEKN